MATHAAQARFTVLFAQLVLEAARLGYEPVYGETSRTKEQQALYVQQGKSKTMRSRHLEGLAGDLKLFRRGVYLTKSEDYAVMGRYWKSLDAHCIWGGDWNDPVDGNHFEWDPRTPQPRGMRRTTYNC